MPRNHEGHRPAVRLLVPGNVRHNSGGNAYNAALARALTALGADTEVCPVGGRWPVGSQEERRRLAGLLLDGAGRTGPGAEEPVTIVDGLLACGAPDALEAAAAAGCPAWILVHMPLAGHGDLERRALQAAAGVICTSSSAAAQLRARHGEGGIRADRIHVALPGTGAAPVAPGSDPPHLVAVAALLPNKDQLLLLGALARIMDLPWTAVLAGSDSADPVYAEQVRNAVARLGLTDRVQVPGELRSDALEAEWARADLSLLISQAETYGMVVTESLARGIPVVVRYGTGAIEALNTGTCGTAGTAGTGSTADAEDAGDGPKPPLPGAAVGLGVGPDAGPAPLEAVLRRWLTDPELRARWSTAALQARDRLPGWDVTARTVLGLLEQHGPGEKEHRG